MNDYRQTLAALKAADLSFLTSDPAAKSAKTATVTAGKASRQPRKRSNSAPTAPAAASMPITAANTAATVDAPSASSASASTTEAPSPKPAAPSSHYTPRPFPATEPVLPVFVPPAQRIASAGKGAGAGNGAIPAAVIGTPAAADMAGVVEVVDTGNPPKKRNRPVHEWPAIGTRLRGEYFGAVYHAEIVAARKTLKSGKQIRLLDGPAQGKRLDSYTKAALVATARQRRADKLGRKGLASGWCFWVAVTPPGTPPEGTECRLPNNSATSP